MIITIKVDKKMFNIINTATKLLRYDTRSQMIRDAIKEFIEARCREGKLPPQLCQELENQKDVKHARREHMVEFTIDIEDTDRNG